MISFSEYLNSLNQHIMHRLWTKQTSEIIVNNMYTVLFLIRQNTTKILCLIKAISNINTGNITTISVANFNMRWNKPIPFLCLCFVKKIVIFSLKYCSINLINYCNIYPHTHTNHYHRLKAYKHFNITSDQEALLSKP